MARDRDTGPAAAQDWTLKKLELNRLKFDKYGDAKRPQNPPLAGRDKQFSVLLKIVEYSRLNF
jgi:hypothetical protein